MIKVSIVQNTTQHEIIIVLLAGDQEVFSNGEYLHIVYENGHEVGEVYHRKYDEMGVIQKMFKAIEKEEIVLNGLKVA